jgi:sortase (surface protein transpeptidase)
LNALKTRLHSLCVSYVGQRIETAQRAIAIAQASANEETKSSAGDKYETGRAMAQLEIEKIQLNWQKP